MQTHPTWPEKIAKRVGNTPDEIRGGTDWFEFKIEFDDPFLNDMVMQAEWAIDAGLMKQPKRGPAEAISWPDLRGDP